jgi:hypothetical protein
MAKFLLLNLLKLSLLRLKLLSDYSSFLKVVKSVLLLDFFILLDLGSKLDRVLAKDSLLLLFNLLLSLSLFFLLLDNS